MLDKKYNPTETEPRIRKFWEENKIYEFNLDASGEIYSIDTPPPTVSGKLHIGHIFSYTQAEMIARYKRIQGYNVFYPFGFDNNGLPTERLVENELKIKAKDLPRSEFNNRCHDIIGKYENDFKELWSSLGFSCDWTRLYKTISPLSQRISQKSFIDLYNKGKVYLEESPVLYCTNCQTSIAQAELESKDIKSTFNYIKFFADNEILEIATTRPELLNSCQAIFINPKDKKNNHFIGKKAVVPLYNFKVPIMSDDNVDMDKGSGMVMCCTFGDTTDLEWYKKYNFSYKKTINSKGIIEDNVEYISGLTIKQARKRIISLLEENGLLIKSISINHTVSVHERCSTEVEILPSKQWYIDVLSSQEKLLNLADEINWYPSHMKTRYITWVKNLKWNWCISRQRYFGVPFPVWYCADCGKVILADEKELPINPIESPPNHPCTCGSTHIIPETAVLDTWATSSVSPLINGHWKENDDITDKIIPMGMRTQAHEIIRTWAFYTIAKTYFHLDRIPWKDIMICGFVLARKGEKISKSKKNSKTDPNQLITTHFADSIRYWTASAKLGTDTTFSIDDLKISKRFITKLWNASKFSLMHLENYTHQKCDYILPQDQWIIDKLNSTLQTASTYLDNYEIGLARNTIDNFFWNDYCDNYLELVKDRLYKPEIHGHENRKSAQFAIYTTLLGILKAYSIFTPFITEEIYKNYYQEHEKEISIHLLKWETKNSTNKNSLQLGTYIKQILSEVRKYKTEHSLSMKHELNKITITLPTPYQHPLTKVLPDLQAATHTKNITINTSETFTLQII